MACFRGALWSRGGWCAKEEDHSRTNPFTGHQPHGFWPTSLLAICSVRPLWRRQWSSVVGHSTGTRGYCLYTQRDVLAWVWYLFVLPFPLPPCPDVLDLLVDFISSLANCIIDISIVFLMFPFPCAFGDLSIIPGLAMLPFSTAATALGFYKSSLQRSSSYTGQLRRCEPLLIPSFPLSWTVTALSQGCCFLCISAYSTCLWIAFSALHIGIEDMEIMYFFSSDIIRDTSQQGIYGQVFNDLF